MAIKPNLLASMGYQYFLSYGAARAELRYKLYFKFLLLRAATRLCRDNRGHHQHIKIALPHRKSTTSNATPCSWHISLIGSNTFCMSSFLSSLVSVKVELKKMRTVLCTSLGSMTSERTSEGPRSYNSK